LGINVNFAPVADLCDDPDSFITSRTAGADPTFVSEYINAVTNIYTYESTVSATLKHFPGYGCNVDTHTGIAVDERTLEDYRSRDFLPFSAGINAGADFVMVSHNVINKIDSNNPASLSPEIHRILNEDLGFAGVTITDDLSMNAIAEYYHGDYPATVQAVLAGNNMLIVSDIETAFTEIKNAVSAGLIDESRLDLVLTPVIKLKIEKDLITL
jgi:beta-N-acetylhexosaminidase